jgi:transglutaminase superfamily protein
MSPFQTFRRLSNRDRALLLEAVLWLTMASLAIAILPFPRIAGIASRKSLVISPTSGKEDLVGRVRWAIAAASSRVPWRAVCFQQGLAAHLMLRRRGINSVLYYGAAHTADSTLAAHVWVRADDLDVVGCEEASQYALLAAFPGDGVRASPT